MMIKEGNGRGMNGGGRVVWENEGMVCVIRN